MNNNEANPGRDSMGRYKNGHNPNPKGRPKKVPQKPESGFDVIFERNITLTAADGSRRELTATQALQHANLKAAFEGKVGAINRVVKWLVKRERWVRKGAEQNEARARSMTAPIFPITSFQRTLRMPVRHRIFSVSRCVIRIQTTLIRTVSGWFWKTGRSRWHWRADAVLTRSPTAKS